MKKYVKNPSADVVILPGIGKLTEGQEVTGDYDQFVPQFLVEVPSGKGKKTLESTPSNGPRHLTEPAPLQTAGVPIATGSPGTSTTENAPVKASQGATVSENASAHTGPQPHGVSKDDHAHGVAKDKDEEKDKDKKSDDDKKHKKSSKGNE